MQYHAVLCTQGGATVRHATARQHRPVAAACSGWHAPPASAQHAVGTAAESNAVAASRHAAPGIVDFVCLPPALLSPPPPAGPTGPHPGYDPDRRLNDRIRRLAGPGALHALVLHEGHAMNGIHVSALWVRAAALHRAQQDGSAGGGGPSFSPRGGHSDGAGEQQAAGHEAWARALAPLLPLTLASLHCYAPRQTANTLHALAKLGLCPAGLVQALQALLLAQLAEASQPPPPGGQAPAFASQELAMSAWALAHLRRLGCPPGPQLVAQLAAAVEAAAPSMSAAGVALSAWGLARLTPPRGSGAAAALSGLLAGLQASGEGGGVHGGAEAVHPPGEGPPHATGTVGGGWTAQPGVLASLPGAAASGAAASPGRQQRWAPNTGEGGHEAGHAAGPPCLLSPALVAQLWHVLPGMRGDYVAMSLWALAHSGTRPNPGLVVALCGALERVGWELQPQGVAMAAWALGRLQCGRTAQRAVAALTTRQGAGWWGRRCWVCPPERA
jgi:hypothetical protein